MTRIIRRRKVNALMREVTPADLDAHLDAGGSVLLSPTAYSGTLTAVGLRRGLFVTQSIKNGLAVLVPSVAAQDGEPVAEFVRVLP